MREGKQRNQFRSDQLKCYRLPVLRLGEKLELTKGFEPPTL